MAFESSDALSHITARFRMSSKNVITISNAELPSPPKVLRIPSHTKSDRNLNAIGLPSNVPANSGPRLASKRGLLTVEVADTGCGISENDQGRLFKPFVQANKEIKQKFGGTGLGLWFCQKLVLAMKGVIECSSERNIGSTFKVKIEANSKSSESEGVLSSSLGSFNVLCLQKHEKEISSELLSFGCTVTACENIHKLTETLSTLKTDYCVMVGLRAAQKIRASCPNVLKPERTVIITSMGLVTC